MALLERWFRSQFVPIDGEFAYNRDGREVIFSRDEVERFVEDWRVMWFSPLIWGGYALLGVALPLLLWHFEYSDAAVVVAVTLAAMLIVALFHVARKPHEAAWERLPLLEWSEGPAQPSVGIALLQIGMAIFWVSTWEHGVNWIWWGVGLRGVIDLAAALWSRHHWRRHGVTPEIPRIVTWAQRAVLAIMAACVLVSTLLRPHDEWLRMQAYVLAVLAVLASAIWLFQRFRSSGTASA